MFLFIAKLIEQVQNALPSYNLKLFCYLIKACVRVSELFFYQPQLLVTVCKLFSPSSKDLSKDFGAQT